MAAAALKPFFNMKILLVTLFGTLLFGNVVGAQTKGQIRTFAWDDVLCRFKGSYDSRKYSEEQLRNTAKLFLPGEGQSLPHATVWDHKDIDGLDVADLEQKYKTARKTLETMKIVDTHYWKAVRQRKLQELDEIYKLSRTTMTAYTKPAVIAEYNGATECKAKYAGPLAAGGDDLLRVWREVNLDSQSKNASPERLQERFDQQLNSPDRFKFALVETMAFGWWNCANAVMRDGPAFADDTLVMEKEFRKLFTSIAEECDEP